MTALGSHLLQVLTDVCPQMTSPSVTHLGDSTMRSFSPCLSASYVTYPAAKQSERSTVSPLWWDGAGGANGVLGLSLHPGCATAMADGGSGSG